MERDGVAMLAVVATHKVQAQHNLQSSIVASDKVLIKAFFKAKFFFS